MMSRNQLLAFIFAAITILNTKALDIPYQVLPYDIYYHCSFINERAAEAYIQVSCADNAYSAILDGCSIPIGGTIYCINDTLRSTFMPSADAAVPANESVNYLSGYYRKPHHDGNMDLSSPDAYRNISGGGYLSADHATMECVSLTADMLCMFYYAKTLDFSNMMEGAAVNVPIAMPYGVERTMQIVYDGTTEYNERTAYKITANFTYEGQFSSYPISIMIDTEWRVPLEFAASIAIGHVEMIYRY